MHFLNMDQMRQRMFGIGNQIPSPTYANIMRSGIYQATGFPQSIQCSELVLKCARCYDPCSRMIKTPKGVTIAFLAQYAIVEVFEIPRGADMKDKTKDEYEAKYKLKMNACKTLVNKEWMIEPRAHHSKAPKTLVHLFEKGIQRIGIPIEPSDGNVSRCIISWMDVLFYPVLSEGNIDQLVKNHKRQSGFSAKECEEI